ncbi:MAG: hypoxanthine phosphoribosyltransferase [Bacteroidetes bacterium GWF2_41_31]|nr:MAG: hypoxanthine phosphoribosyltransferase [Bacteroidetes bacterium GWF2_41_31]OFZ09392.1 MAG: hypoxanthine phosphoribosyltransferase [Bacteroidetes bacterium RIFOXYB12_FULL_41_6]
MNTIQIHDKQFEPFITYATIDETITRIAEQLNTDFKGKTPLFLVILNGSFMFAADLLKKVNIPCEISFVKLSSYSGTQSTTQVRELIGFNEEVKGRSVIILEDIIDTGITMEKILERLNDMGSAEVKVATLLFKPSAFQKEFTIDYIGIQIPNDFIVGFGLDYNGLGRNTKDIYKIVEPKLKKSC